MELKPEMFKKLLPLPVTVITTVDENGVSNAAPWGCVMPILRPFDLITIASALPRHTLHNIRATGEFTVNVFGNPGFREAMQTAKAYPAGVSELDELGLETLPGVKVQPPRMKDALGWIEAILVEEILRENYSLIIGRVLCAELNDAYVTDEALNELPAVMLMPQFRATGGPLSCQMKDIPMQFSPPLE